MPNFDFMNKLRKNVLSGNDYQFVPLQRVEGANNAGLMPNGTLANAPQPEIKGLQIDENGKMYETDIEPEVRSSFVKNLVNNIGNKILGTPVGAASNIEQIGDNEFNASLSKTPRQGGFLNNIANGYRENYYQPFSINNLGQNRGWGTRLGEGFGTLGRFVDSSLGRGILAAGLSAATGYGEPLEELAIATVGRQRAKTADRLYRDQLKAQGINTDDIKGNITPDVYKNIANSYRLNNQVRWGDLAEFNPQIAEAIQNNPDLADSFAPSTIVQQILKTGLTDAQIANLLARTEKTKAETGQVGKPKVSINIKQGGTKSVIEHKSGGGENGSTGGKPVPKKNTTTYKEGQTATNPQTGEKMVFRGGKWQRL